MRAVVRVVAVVVAQGLAGPAAVSAAVEPPAAFLLRLPAGCCTGPAGRVRCGRTRPTAYGKGPRDIARASSVEHRALSIEHRASSVACPGPEYEALKFKSIPRYYHYPPLMITTVRRYGTAASSSSQPPPAQRRLPGFPHPARAEMSPPPPGRWIWPPLWRGRVSTFFSLREADSAVRTPRPPRYGATGATPSSPLLSSPLLRSARRTCTAPSVDAWPWPAPPPRPLYFRDVAWPGSHWGGGIARPFFHRGRRCVRKTSRRHEATCFLFRSLALPGLSSPADNPWPFYRWASSRAYGGSTLKVTPCDANTRVQVRHRSHRKTVPPRRLPSISLAVLNNLLVLLDCQDYLAWLSSPYKIG